MRFPRPLLSRIRALESHLGVSYVKDRWGDPEYVDSEYSEWKAIKKRLNHIEKKLFTVKELKEFNRWDD